MNVNPQQIILALAAQMTNVMIERDEALMKLAELEQRAVTPPQGATEAD